MKDLPPPATEPLPTWTKADLFGRLSPEIHAAVVQKALEPGVEGVFVMEAAELFSGNLPGDYVVQYGPGKTFKAGDLHLGRLVPAPTGGSQMFRMVGRCPRSEFTFRFDSSNPPAAGPPTKTVRLGAEPSPVGADEARREWPVLYKKTTGGKTQEWEIWVERTAEGHGRICTRYGLQDGKKQEQQDVVEAGKNAGKKNATTPYQQACLEAEAEWKKQLERKGYGRDVAASAEVRGQSPMLAHPIDKVKPAEIDWATAHAQPKLDGFRCLATKRDGVVSLRSRENKPIETMGHVAEYLTAHLPEGLTVDGELYRHGLAFQDLSSRIKRLRPESAAVQYHVYDVLLPDKFADRHALLRSFLTFSGEPVRLVLTATVNHPDGLTAFQAEQVAAGYEGAMLRHTALGYEAGKRSKTLLKVKTFKDEEFGVVEVRQGRGTHKGMAIFLCETAAGHRFEVTAPGGHHEKRQYWLNRDKCVGAGLTVKFFEYSTGAQPVPRFPVGLRFKDEPFEMPPDPEAGARYVDK